MLNVEKYENCLYEKLFYVMEKRVCLVKVQLFFEICMFIELNYVGECRGLWIFCKIDFDVLFYKKNV